MSTLEISKVTQEISSADLPDINLKKLNESIIFTKKYNPTDFVGEQIQSLNSLALDPVS